MKGGTTSIPSCRQRGAALVITLMVLAAVTMLGVAAMNATCVEYKLSRNEREVQESFYLAEAAVIEAVQRLHGLPHDDLSDHVSKWHHVRHNEEGQVDFRKPENWIVEESREPNAMGSTLHPQSFFTAVEWDVAVGASLIVTGSRLYANRIYGISKREISDTLIEIGYYMRY